MLSITTESNYLAQVVQLGEPKKHPNADRLQIFNVHGYEVISDLSKKEGDICIYFPPECQIDSKILSKLNLYSDKDLNEDKTIAGYIHKSGRVKCLALRGVISEGMLLPADEISDIGALWLRYIGEQFDTINGQVICQKYVPPVKEQRVSYGQKPKGEKLSDYLVPGQFNFHYSTSKLQDNIWKFDNVDDVIVITDKWHGTSAIYSNLLIKNKLSTWKKILKFFGQNIPTEQFRKMYASRTVLKSIEGTYHTPSQGYYNTDIWGKVFEEIKHVLFEGYTIYGEIVGYTGESMIQKGYDYGCKPGEHKFLVYRITHTYADGQVIEYSWEDIVDFCKEHNLETVKVFFNGTISRFLDIARSLDSERDSIALLDNLKKVYLEKDCQFCTNKVPSEGICIRNESKDKIAFKLKSRRFLEHETKALDSGEEVVE